jgi:phosphorylcholine metabolism protein LicD
MPSNSETHETLKSLLFEFTKICDEHGIKPILLAGGLLGWNFNQEMLPWDDDLDFVVMPEDIEKVKALDGYDQPNLFIEVNPHSSILENNPYNMIDARVISKRNGVFIDLVFAFVSPKNPKVLLNKTPHDKFDLELILPQKRSTINGIGVWVPANPQAHLASLYGKQALNSHGHGPPGHDRRAWYFKDGAWHKKNA